MDWAISNRRDRRVSALGFVLAGALLCAFADPVADADPLLAVDAPVAEDAAVASEFVASDEASDEAAAFESGRASYYADKFHGRRTANGERFDNAAMTAAHRTLPMGTMVKVTCDKSGRSVTVRVNDRGPYAHNRVIDLSKAAARELGMLSAGITSVTLEVLPTT